MTPYDNAGTRIRLPPESIKNGREPRW